MAKRKPPVDVVLVGFGWTASIIAQELTDEGLQVLALERGEYRDTVPDFAEPHIQDELRYAIRKQIFESPRRETLTFRNNRKQQALPMRNLGSFMPAAGVGGAGVHWNGLTWRFEPADFVLYDHVVQRYGRKFIPDGMQLQNWGVTYADLEPYYDKFEYLCGTSGKAGNIQGTMHAGGNRFEGPRQREYPLPPLKRAKSCLLFDEAARAVDMDPFPIPAGNTSEAYRNPLGVQMGKCTYCGFCEWFGCANYSKASPQTTILPVLLKKDNFQYRTHCDVVHVNTDPSGKRATGVNYIDLDGEMWEQPAGMVVLCAFAQHNVHLLLLSKIGKPYNPDTGEGVVGRNYAYQIVSSVDVFQKEILNPFMGAGALGQAVDNFNTGNFDHGPKGFIGGGLVYVMNTGGRPILQHHIPKDAPQWGSGWKKAMRDNYLTATSLSTEGSVMSYRNNYLDLDPTWKDVYGNPLLRLTFDYQPNEHAMSGFLTDQATKVAKAMHATSIHPKPRTGHYSIVPYQTTHNTGGAAMGDDPRTSFCNRYLQAWDMPNLWVMGSTVFPQNAGYNPTGTVGALTFWAAAAMKRYLRHPGPLVSKS